MCGRYGGPREAEVHAGFLDVVAPFSNLPRYQDYRPTDIAPVFVKNRLGETVLKDMRWWFVPATHKGALKDWKLTTFNARLDDIRAKPTFRRAWDLKRRVLVPARTITSGPVLQGPKPAGASHARVINRWLLPAFGTMPKRTTARFCLLPFSLASPAQRLSACIRGNRSFFIRANGRPGWMVTMTFRFPRLGLKPTLRLKRRNGTVH